jgi:hypothetical protein
VFPQPVDRIIGRIIINFEEAPFVYFTQRRSPGFWRTFTFLAVFLSRIDSVGPNRRWIYKLGRGIIVKASITGGGFTRP